jgi:tetratricopeptide (TPR) repeat protein
MNQRKRLVLGLAFLGSTVIATSCKNPLAEMVKLAKQQELTVDPNPLELHGDQVAFKMSAKLPVKMMKKGTKYTMEVSYMPGDIETMSDVESLKKDQPNPYADAQKVGAIPFDGDQYQGQTADPKVSKDFSFAYQDKFETGGLIVKGIASKGTGEKMKTREFGPVRLKVADGRFVKGVATTCRLVKSPIDGLNPTTGESPFAYGDHGYTGPKDEFLEIPLFFERGSANVNPTTANNKLTMETISTLFKDTKMPPFEAMGASSHSPEGSEAVNTGLAENRAKAMEMAFANMLKRFKYKKEEIEVYKFNFEKKVLGNTLPEFRSLVNGSSLSPEQKTEAAEIMEADGDFVEKEMKLHGKPYYKTLMDEVYPKMRYAKTNIKKPGAAKSLAEMSALTKKMMEGTAKTDTLTEQEFLYAAANTPDLKERVDILLQGAKSYDTWKIHNNIGASYLDMALLMNDKTKADDAIKHLEMSMAKRETGEAAYNLAMAYSMKGDKAKMEEYLQKASNLGADNNPQVTALINGAKGYLAIKAAKARDDGKYKEAEDILGSAPQTNPNLYNKGLAQLLQGVNYDGAIASLTSAAQKNPNDAWTQYVTAIAYSRKGDEGNMSAALKKACELDNSLKAKALKDVEFDRYKNNQPFKDAIK